ncbi:MAG: tetratricopeptide repeat protein [bacterium]
MSGSETNAGLPQLEASLGVDPSPRNVVRVADAFRLAGRPAVAAEWLRALCAERPDLVAPRILLGWCARDLGHHEEADAAFAEARELDPTNPFAVPVTLPEQEPADDLVIERWDADSQESSVETALVSEIPVEPAREAERVLDLPEDEAPVRETERVLELPVEDSALPVAADPRAIPEIPTVRRPRDPEAEAEPERALTEEELRDVPPSPLYSATLAEIFERQGFEEKAIEIYLEVVRSHPERSDLRDRISELAKRSLPGAGR